MSRLNLDELSIHELAELAAQRDLIDRAEQIEGRYRIEIGAASFTLDAEGTREFLLRLIRKHSVDVE